MLFLFPNETHELINLGNFIVGDIPQTGFEGKSKLGRFLKNK
jgi:hypothetical protein